MQRKKKIAIIGSSGYTGLELLKLVLGHSNCEPYFLMSRTYAGMKVSDVFPSIVTDNDKDIPFFKIFDKRICKASDVIFLCLPPGKSMEFIKDNLKNSNSLIIDVGSDYRMDDPKDYSKWYKIDHVTKGLMRSFVYGLCEFNREKIKKARMIANPGCYPTSVLLGLIPLISSNIEIFKDVIVDSKSGVTGAGKKLSQDFLFGNLNENFYSYKPIMHRHIGEMEIQLEKITKRKTIISFTPHLLPVDRGIFSSIYLRCKEAVSQKEIDSVYDDAYSGEMFVNYFIDKVPHIKDVTGTNNCNINAVFDERTKTIKVFTVIDNLIKGAAGQAIQNMNIALGLPECEGLKKQGAF